MYFKYRQMTRWPALAWIAKLDVRQDAIEIDHGPRVETRNDWFCEAVWAGNFADGDFDRTDRVFGSGARIRNGAATFVSSGSTADRLVSLNTGDITYISNSLICLLNRVEATVDRMADSYPVFFASIARGLANYDRELLTSGGAVRFTYFNNLKWDGDTLNEIAKPDGVDYFESFEEYHAFLQTSANAIAVNLHSASRRSPYSMLGVISSDYNATAATTLAASVGMREAITFEDESDSLQSVAAALGISIARIERDAWREIEARPEAICVSADGVGRGVIFRGAERQLAGRLLITGFNAGEIWAKPSANSASSATSSTGSSDLTGMSLTEYRLAAGFIHCPIASLGLRHAADVHRISVSGEMSPWDVGGENSQPVCRKIVERAGVPRYAFGTNHRESVDAMKITGDLLTPTTRREYQRWLVDLSPEFWRRRRLPPTWSDAIKRSFSFGRRATEIERPADRFMFPWALERAKQIYTITEPTVIRRAA